MIKPIVIYTHSCCDIYALQIWDYYLNVTQAKDHPYPSNITISFEQNHKNIDSNALNILHISFFEVKDINDALFDTYLKKFDLIFYDNNMEHGMVLDERIVNHLQHESVFLIMGSILA